MYGAAVAQAYLRAAKAAKGLGGPVAQSALAEIALMLGEHVYGRDAHYPRERRLHVGIVEHDLRVHGGVARYVVRKLERVAFIGRDDAVRVKRDVEHAHVLAKATGTDYEQWLPPGHGAHLRIGAGRNIKV